MSLNIFVSLNFIRFFFGTSGFLSGVYTTSKIVRKENDPYIPKLNPPLKPEINSTSWSLPPEWIDEHSG